MTPDLKVTSVGLGNASTAWSWASRTEGSRQSHCHGLGRQHLQGQRDRHGVEHGQSHAADDQAVRIGSPAPDAERSLTGGRLSRRGALAPRRHLPSLLAHRLLKPGGGMSSRCRGSAADSARCAGSPPGRSRGCRHCGQRDVHGLTVQRDRQRMVAIEAGAVPVQRFPRTGDVGDHRVERWCRGPGARETSDSNSSETLNADSAAAASWAVP